MENNKQRSAQRGSPSGENGDSEGEEQDELSSSKQIEDELASFRARWQQEIRAQPIVKGQHSTHQIPLKPEENKSESEENLARGLFIEGIEMERAGKLYEAIQFYRKAVQIDPDIEFKLDYKSKQFLNDIKEEDYEEIHNNDDSISSDEEGEVIEDGQLLPRIQKKISKVGFLCTQKFDQSATHISALPLEILLYILRWVVSSDLDLRSLEMFGSVCRGFYLCSRDPEIWRLSCQRIWGLNCSSSPDNYGSWRNMYIERSRLNFNGCYISKTTYIRHGENSFQDQFYRPWHLVSYYRYLRFFPEGIVLMLTSPDDPVQSVSQMKTRHPRQPVMIGYYRLKGDKVTLVVHKQGRSIQPIYKKNSRRKEVDHSEQTFHMELKIHNHKDRRHVKLVWTYYSVFVRSKQGHESTSNFDLIGNRFPPLWFSRVKSFTSESDQPLN